jgi:hypothetical protein
VDQFHGIVALHVGQVDVEIAHPGVVDVDINVYIHDLPLIADVDDIVNAIIVVVWDRPG